MFDALVKSLFEQGGLVALAVFLVPGFIAWRTMQARKPQGEQKAADAIVTIAVYSIVISALWYSQRWTSMPSTWSAALLFLAQVIVSPIVLALVLEWALALASAHGWITSPYPRAWDFIFNELAVNSKKYEHNGLFLIVTLHDGGKIAGLYTEPGHASLWPYDRDLFIGKLWELDKNQRQPLRQVTGSLGVYVDQGDILTIEILDYAAVLAGAIASATSTGDGNG